MTESVNQAAFFAALSMHINAHPDLPTLASVASDSMLQISGHDGIAAAIAWAHTLGGDKTITIGAHPDGKTGVLIHGTLAGHDVRVFTVDDNRLHELLPPDVGQPYFERARTITLAGLEACLATPTTTTEEDRS